MLTGQRTDLFYDALMVRNKKRRLPHLLIIAAVLVSVNCAQYSQGAIKTVTTKAQVIKSISNMKILMDQSDAELLALENVTDDCLDKFAMDNPDNRQIRDSLAFCASDPSVKKYNKLLLENADLQDLTQNAVLAAQRALKVGGNYEAEFILAINFQFAVVSFSNYASKQTWQVKANELALLAKVQNLYEEGQRIAQKYNSKQARSFLVKSETKNDLSEAKPYLAFFRKAAFT